MSNNLTSAPAGTIEHQSKTLIYQRISSRAYILLDTPHAVVNVPAPLIPYVGVASMSVLSQLTKATAALAVVSCMAPATAGVIFSATSGSVNVSSVTSITQTFNQSGLLSGYTANVTDFDTYLATNPLHSVGFTNEWFSSVGINSAQVVYDLGSGRGFDAIAYWNEESAGVGLMNVLVSNDGTNFAPLVSGLTPTDHPTANYGADVFSFGAVSARYVRLDISGCPQPNTSSFYNGCSIGEIAFREARIDNNVPEPASLALLAVALLGLAATRRR